ncbi:MAG: GldG family protein [Ruminococcus sp.]|nr:GldG family protein [Ruminococcus sp.]
MSKNKKEEIEKVNESTAADESSKKSASKKRGKGKKLKYGSMSLGIVIVVIAIVVLLNLMCGLIVKRYPIKLDLTSDKRYDLTDESIDALKSLEKDVDVVVTCPESDFEGLSAQYANMYYQYYGANVEVPYTIIPEILDKYSMYAESGKGSVNVKYVDINRDPDVVARYKKNYNGEITAQSLIFACGDRVKVVSQQEVIGMVTFSKTSIQNNIQMVFNGESTITSAIMSVADSKPIRVGIVSMMNGSSVVNQVGANITYSTEEFLNKNGYDCTEVDIATDDLIENYDMLVLCCPAYDFSEDIITKMSDFLYNDGKYEKDMIYMPSLNALNIPNITEFLADWKIQIEESYIKDGTNSVAISGKLYPTITVSDSEEVGALPNDTLPIVAPFGRNITVLDKNNETVIKELLKSNETSYTSSLADDSDSDDRAAYDIVVKARKETSSGISVYGSDLLVLGSPYMIDSSIVSNTNTYNNAEVLLKVINNMSGKENGAIIPEKALQQNNISPSAREIMVIRILVIFVLPLIIACIGIVVLLRRKNR